MKIKESEKRDKYLDLAGELKKAEKKVGQGNFNCSWCAWKGSSGARRGDWRNWKSVGTIKTTALLRSARILRRVLET